MTWIALYFCYPPFFSYLEGKKESEKLRNYFFLRINNWKFSFKSILFHCYGVMRLTKFDAVWVCGGVIALGFGWKWISFEMRLNLSVNLFVFSNKYVFCNRNCTFFPQISLPSRQSISKFCSWRFGLFFVLHFWWFIFQILSLFSQFI